MDLNEPTTKRTRGRPRSSPELVTHQLAIRLTDVDREALRRLAGDRGVSLSTYIVDVLKLHLKSAS